MTMMTWAEEELRRAGWMDENGLYGSMMGNAVLKMLRVFEEEGHSGMSASIAVGLFSALAKWEPLTPLTGEDDEWNEVGTGVWQNKRCSRVFKREGVGAYNIDGRVFREPSGACYISLDSHVPVTFPYTPATEYVDVTPDVGMEDDRDE